MELLLKWREAGMGHCCSSQCKVVWRNLEFWARRCWYTNVLLLLVAPFDFRKTSMLGPFLNGLKRNFSSRNPDNSFCNIRWKEEDCVEGKEFLHPFHIRMGCRRCSWGQQASLGAAAVCRRLGLVLRRLYHKGLVLLGSTREVPEGQEKHRQSWAERVCAPSSSVGVWLAMIPLSWFFPLSIIAYFPQKRRGRRAFIFMHKELSVPLNWK